MSHITRGQEGNRLEDWQKSMMECKAKTCDECGLTNMCENPKKKIRHRRLR